MNLRHITRFTYMYTNFQGWRVAINRQGTALARYFSDKQFGSEDAARDEAIRFRDMLLDEINQNPLRTREILDKYRVQAQKPYPAGLKPGKTEDEECSNKVSGCSIRSNHVMQRVLRGICHKLQLDTASVMKLSLYMFALQYNGHTARIEQMMASDNPYSEGILPGGYPCSPGETLQRLVSELEYHARQTGMPCFEEFSTGRTRFTVPPDNNPQHNTSAPPPDMYSLPINNAPAYLSPPQVENYVPPSITFPGRPASIITPSPSSSSLQDSSPSAPALSALLLRSPI